MLDEAAAKDRLAAHGLAVPPGRRVTDVEAAIAAAREIGFPVAVKALGLAHKTEAQALRLDLKDEQELRSAVKDLLPLGKGLYLEAMVAEPVCEVLAGLTRDPQFGLVLTLAFGGVLVEMLEDSRTLLLPFSRGDVEEALDSLKAAPLLDGFRARPRADKTALLDLVMDLQRFALAEGDAILELDINPIIVCAEGKGAFAADALIMLEGKPDV